jgi:hypothetical protein
MCFYVTFKDDFRIHSFSIREATKSPKDTCIGEHVGSHQPIANVGVQQHGTI